MVCVNNISLDYNFGFTMSNIEYFTAFARNGNSEVSLAVVNPEEKIVTVNGVTGPVTIPGTVQSESGGIVTLALTVKLGPGERLEQSQQNITVSVIDTYDYKVHDPATASITFNLKDVTYWYELVNDSVTGKASWVPADIIPGDSVGNRDGSHNRVFCGLAFWDSTTIPSLNYDPLMGHNGNHALQVTAIDGTASKELYFEEYDAITGTWGNDYDMTVKDGTVYVRNLTVTNVHSSTGTEDYFRYSYLYDSPYNEPTINFTIDDIDNPELEPTYMVYISAWPTAATPTLFAESFVLPANSVVVDTVFNSPGAKSVNLADFNVDLEHGTYAYEIEIHKYVDNNLIDWFALKWPYCLTIGEHSLHATMISDIQEAMLINFEILDACYDNNNHAPYQGGVNVTVDAFDNNLNKRASKTFNDVSVGDKVKNEVLANIQSYESEGLWRSIYTGEDKCWQEYRRDHKGSRMLATNITDYTLPWRAYIYIFGETGGFDIGHVSFGMDQHRYVGTYSSVEDDYDWDGDVLSYIWTFGSYPSTSMVISKGTLYSRITITNAADGKGRLTELEIFKMPVEYTQSGVLRYVYQFPFPELRGKHLIQTPIYDKLERFVYEDILLHRTLLAETMMKDAHAKRLTYADKEFNTKQTFSADYFGDNGDTKYYYKGLGEYNCYFFAHELLATVNEKYRRHKKDYFVRPAEFGRQIYLDHSTIQNLHYLKDTDLTTDFFRPDGVGDYDDEVWKTMLNSSYDSSWFVRKSLKFDFAVPTFFASGNVYECVCYTCGKDTGRWVTWGMDKNREFIANNCPCNMCEQERSIQWTFGGSEQPPPMYPPPITSAEEE